MSNLLQDRASPFFIRWVPDSVELELQSTAHAFFLFSYRGRKIAGHVSLYSCCAVIHAMDNIVFGLHTGLRTVAAHQFREIEQGGGTFGAWLQRRADWSAGWQLVFMRHMFMFVRAGECGP